MQPTALDGDGPVIPQTQEDQLLQEEMLTWIADDNPEEFDSGLSMNSAQINWVVPNSGKTYLHEAVEKQSTQIVALLVKNRANPFIKNSQGENSIQACVRTSNLDALRLILEYLVAQRPQSLHELQESGPTGTNLLEWLNLKVKEMKSAEDAKIWQNLIESVKPKESLKVNMSRIQPEAPSEDEESDHELDDDQQTVVLKPESGNPVELVTGSGYFKGDPSVQQSEENGMGRSDKVPTRADMEHLPQKLVQEARTRKRQEGFVGKAGKLPQRGKYVLLYTNKDGEQMPMDAEGFQKFALQYKVVGQVLKKPDLIVEQPHLTRPLQRCASPSKSQTLNAPPLCLALPLLAGFMMHPTSYMVSNILNPATAYKFASQLPISLSPLQHYARGLALVTFEHLLSDGPVTSGTSSSSKDQNSGYQQSSSKPTLRVMKGGKLKNVSQSTGYPAEKLPSLLPPAPASSMPLARLLPHLVPALLLYHNYYAVSKHTKQVQSSATTAAPTNPPPIPLAAQAPSVYSIRAAGGGAGFPQAGEEEVSNNPNQISASELRLQAYYSYLNSSSAASFPHSLHVCPPIEVELSGNILGGAPSAPLLKTTGDKQKPIFHNLNLQAPAVPFPIAPPGLVVPQEDGSSKHDADDSDQKTQTGPSFEQSKAFQGIPPLIDFQPLPLSIGQVLVRLLANCFDSYDAVVEEVENCIFNRWMQYCGGWTGVGAEIRKARRIFRLMNISIQNYFKQYGLVAAGKIKRQTEGLQPNISDEGSAHSEEERETEEIRKPEKTKLDDDSHPKKSDVFKEVKDGENRNATYIQPKLQVPDMDYHKPKPIEPQYPARNSYTDARVAAYQQRYLPGYQANTWNQRYQQTSAYQMYQQSSAYPTRGYQQSSYSQNTSYTPSKYSDNSYAQMYYQNAYNQMGQSNPYQSQRPDMLQSTVTDGAGQAGYNSAAVAQQYQQYYSQQPSSQAYPPYPHSGPQSSSYPQYPSASNYTYYSGTGGTSQQPAAQKSITEEYEQLGKRRQMKVLGTDSEDLEFKAAPQTTSPEK